MDMLTPPQRVLRDRARALAESAMIRTGRRDGSEVPFEASASRMRRVAARPSRTGILTSIRIRSGRSFSH